MKHTPEQIAQKWNESCVLVAAVHEGDNYVAAHVISLMEFTRESTDLVKKGKIVHELQSQQPLDYMRSLFAAKVAAEGSPFTHLFFYDTDMEIKLEHITQLLMRDVACVSGDYYMGAWKLKQTKEKNTPYRPFPTVASRKGEYISRREMKDAELDAANIPIAPSDSRLNV